MSLGWLLSFPVEVDQKLKFCYSFMFWLTTINLVISTMYNWGTNHSPGFNNSHLGGFNAL